MREVEITRAITERYFEKFLSCVESDVLIAGAGPCGLICARELAREGRRVVVLEKRLAPGGGIWGGGMNWNEVAVQEEARPILEDLGVRHLPRGDGLFTADSVELASTLVVEALRAGATILNLTYAEDVIVEEGRVVGLVVNRTGLAQGTLPIDPLGIRTKAVLDGTGHEAAIANYIVNRGHALRTPSGRLEGERAMDAESGERFVVDHAGEAFPGLFISGMACCAVFGGPRMGPIFGGMLMSGKKVAGVIREALTA